MTIELYAEIDRLREDNENLLKKLERSNDAWIREVEDKRALLEKGKSMLAIFDLNLDGNTVGRKICDEMRTAIAQAERKT